MIEKKTIPNLDEKKIQCNRLCFISISIGAVLKFLVSIKNFGKYKKLP